MHLHIPFACAFVHVLHDRAARAVTNTHFVYTLIVVTVRVRVCVDAYIFKII